MVHKVVKSEAFLTPAYGSRSIVEPIPKYELSATGLGPETTYELIRD